SALPLEDIDEDEILRTLSPEELEQLDCELQEMDPENMLLPAGLRQRDQTKKSPTGPLDREALLQYLEQQALEVKERDDLVPFTGEKKESPSLPTTLMRFDLGRTLSGGGEGGRQHEGQRPLSDRLINRALGCMQLTLGMTLVEGGGGIRSMGSCVHCREGMARLKMNRSEILI
uniref:Tropomodulin 4 n=1 Tax=Spermophilus dauricus TaxID=99837 RepID=A0A8C9QQX6_SPEDA